MLPSNLLLTVKYFTSISSCVCFYFLTLWSLFTTVQDLYKAPSQCSLTEWNDIIIAVHAKYAEAIEEETMNFPWTGWK